MVSIWTGAPSKVNASVRYSSPTNRVMPASYVFRLLMPILSLYSMHNMSLNPIRSPPYMLRFLQPLRVLPQCLYPLLSNSPAASSSSPPPSPSSTAFPPGLTTDTPPRHSTKHPVATKNGIPTHRSPNLIPNRNSAAQAGHPANAPPYVSTDTAVYNTPRCSPSTIVVITLRVGIENASPSDASSQPNVNNTQELARDTIPVPVMRKTALICARRWSLVTSGRACVRRR